MIGSDKQPWMAEGNCLGANPNLFFPERGFSNEPAKEICKLCDVRVECLEFALEGHEPGVYGQTSDRERRTIRRLGTSAVDYIAGLDAGTISPPRRGRPLLVVK